MKDENNKTGFYVTWRRIGQSARGMGIVILLVGGVSLVFFLASMVFFPSINFSERLGILTATAYFGTFLFVVGLVLLLSAIILTQPFLKKHDACHRQNATWQSITKLAALAFLFLFLFAMAFILIFLAGIACAGF